MILANVDDVAPVSIAPFYRKFPCGKNRKSLNGTIMKIFFKIYRIRVFLPFFVFNIAFYGITG